MDKQTAFRIGFAFATGRVLQGIAQDDGRFITVHPNGKDKEGRVVKIDDDGTIKGGLGNKFNGEKINEISSKENKAKRKERVKIDLSLPERIDKDKILQNRDRSTQGSIAQMRSIASKPDYYRMSGSRSFGSGAPVIAYGSYKPEQLGKKDIAVMPDGKQYAVQYAVVDADDVLTSNDIAGRSNKAYYSDDPGKKRAIAGNGRLTAMQFAYQNDKAAEYKQAMMDNYSEHGVSESVIKRMKSPVLVRVMQAKDVTKDIGDKSNTSANLQMTAVEMAENDKNRVDFDKIEIDEDGDYTDEAVTEFVKQMPQSEQGGMIDTDGSPTLQAVQRLDAAIFHKAYGNDNLTRLATQKLKAESRNILAGLKKAAPMFAKLSGGDPRYDCRELLTQAATKAIQARREGKNLHDVAREYGLDLEGKGNDGDAVGMLIELFAANSRSAQGIANGLTSIAKAVLEKSYNQTGDMFGDTSSIDDIIRHSLKNHVKNKSGYKTDMFATDAKPRIYDFWRKNAARFFRQAWDGKPVDSFFDDLEKKLR